MANVCDLCVFTDFNGIADYSGTIVKIACNNVQSNKRQAQQAMVRTAELLDLILVDIDRFYMGVFFVCVWGLLWNTRRLGAIV